MEFRKLGVAGKKRLFFADRYIDLTNTNVMRHSKRWIYLIWTSHSLWKEFLDWRSIEYFLPGLFSPICLCMGHFVDFNFPASEAQKVSKVDSEIWRPLALGLWQPMLVWFCRRNRSCAYPVRDVEQSWWKFEIPSLQMLCSLESSGTL